MSKSWHTQGTLLGTYFLELYRNSESQVLTRRYLIEFLGFWFG
jgi:hypothetical protein